MTLAAQSESECADVIETTHLGKVTWDSGSELYLPSGLPGFEEERRMIPVEVPVHRPLVFLQSVRHSEVCFVSLPVLIVCPDFDLSLTEDDCAALMLDEKETPRIGSDVLCLALLRRSGGTVETNLDAPIIINLHNSRCVQSLSPDAARGYYRLNDEGVWERIC
jgi:flagellar assembly factor FliW